MQPNPLISMVPIAAIFLIFYVLIIRPQQKQMKEHEQMLGNLKKGDKVVTNGGIYGVIMGFRDSDVELKIADNVKVLVTRSSITRVAAQASGAAESNAKPLGPVTAA